MQIRLPDPRRHIEKLARKTGFYRFAIQRHDDCTAENAEKTAFHLRNVRTTVTAF